MMKKTILSILLLLPLATSMTFAASNKDAANKNVANMEAAKLDKLQRRLNIVERKLGSQVLVNMQLNQELLQQEVQQLRGEVEDLSHQLKELKRHQRDLYQDIDRRLLALERGGTINSTPLNDTEATDNEVVEPVVTDANEQAEYQQAFSLLREFRYAQAASAFDRFLNKYPQGRYAAIARYWLAESYYTDRKYKAAIGEYQALVQQHPKSPKVAEAMLKIGYCQYELKQWQDTRSTMESVLKRYPGTTEGSQAEKYLQRLKQQGH